MRNLISFSCSRAVLSFCVATIKVSRHRASKLSFDLEMVSFSHKSKCLVPGCNWTAQRHFCPTVLWLVAVSAVPHAQKGSWHHAVALAPWIARQLWLSALVSAGSPCSELVGPGASQQTSRKPWPTSLSFTAVQAASASWFLRNFWSFLWTLITFCNCVQEAKGESSRGTGFLLFGVSELLVNVFFYIYRIHLLQRGSPISLSPWDWTSEAPYINVYSKVSEQTQYY